MKFSKRIAGFYYLYKGKVRLKISRIVGQEIYGKSIDTYSSKKMINAISINKAIYDGILSNRPFMVSRFGSIELSTTGTFYFNLKNDYEKVMERVCFNAGFFPNDVNLGFELSELMIRSCSETDVLAVWFVQYEDFFVKNILDTNAKICYLMNIEPWKVQDPWTKALEGKRVLVIHPFDESIKKQYLKRSKLFTNPDILPEFELKTLKAVQTIAGTKDDRFSSWFDALEYMYCEAMKIEFDVAILGCGAYGMPLAAMLKRAGKQAIHLGGVTQILFGIKGKRWESTSAYRYIKDLFNDEWTSPSESERPKESNNVEKGCYW